MKYLLGLAILLLLACQTKEPQASAKAKTKKPYNILFIMSDDHAEKAISAYSKDLINTPNIDRIANEGILFKNSFVTNSICAPARAVLLTGKYSHLNGLRDNRDRFDGDQLTFPKLLQKAGYQTSIVGKWHLKTEPQGFDYWNILIGQGYYYNPVMIDNGDTLNHEGYTSDIITDLAIQNLENRDADKPFCMLYHHKAPHRNWMPDPKHFDLFEEDIPLPETFWDDYEGRRAAAEQDQSIKNMYMQGDMKLQPEHSVGYPAGTGGGPQAHDPVNAWTNNSYGRLTPEQKAKWDAHYIPIGQDFKARQLKGKELVEWQYQRYMKDYLMSVQSVDDNVGRMLDYLDESGLAENTLVVYTSDQGFYLGEHGWYDKRFMYEESLSMPLVARLPGVIPPNQINEDMVLNLDFAPTIMDYAGLAIPTDFQGASLRPIMEAKTPEDWRSSMYYHYYEYPHGWHKVKQHYGVRTERYKLIHFYHDIDEWELYDLQEDPNEMNNLINSQEHQDIISELKAEIQKLRKDLDYKEV